MLSFRTKLHSLRSLRPSLFSGSSCLFSSSSPSTAFKSKSEEMIAVEEKYGAHNYHPLPVVLEKAEGIFVWDVEGRQFFDFLSAYSAVNQGHGHPRIIEALHKQANKLTLTSRAFYNDALGEFCEFITGLFGYEKVLPMNTGAEAVETAVKLARRWGYEVKGVPKDEAHILFAKNNFHGRTMTAISASNDPDSFNNFGPFVPGISRVDFGNTQQLEEALQSNPNIVAFVVEPIQGEAGVIVPPTDYLRDVRRLCDQYNVLMVCDEIQSGLGRTGQMLCSYHSMAPPSYPTLPDGCLQDTYNPVAHRDGRDGESYWKPDMVLLGKALSGGTIPVSCVLADDEVMLVIKPGEHGSTYGGNPLGCRIAIESLKVLVEENLLDNARQTGYHLKQLLTQKLIEEGNGTIGDVRGRGLFCAIELTEEAAQGEGDKAMEICHNLMNNGLLCKPTHKTIIRLSPPLPITREQVDVCAQIIADTVNH